MRGTVLSATSRQTGGALAEAQRPRRLGLALAVIATAQLMVVLDATIVNVALPHIQHALGFSGTNLEWVVNAYALAFGGLLLLGGRSGDLLGRRRIFIFGILLFTGASLVGGFATTQAWLLTARVFQGVGGAFAAPTSLSLIAVTFPEGRQRNRAMGVYAAMSIAGGAVGLIAGGLLVDYLDWRWVLWVNVPIGLIVALLAPRVLGESERRRGAFDLPGAITGSLGLGALVYGLSSAATTFSNGQAVSHWGDTKVIVSLVAAVVLLVAFVIIEARSRSALVPPRVVRSRNRSGAYLISLCIGTALFGMFFFLTLFVQNVWGYSPLKSGIAYLPMVATIMLGSALASQLVGRIGARPLIITGSALASGGMFWLSRLTETQLVRGRAARADDGDRARHGAHLRADLAGVAVEGLQQRRRRRVVAAQYRTAGRRGARARGARHGGVERGGVEPAVGRRGGGARCRRRTCPRPRRPRRSWPRPTTRWPTGSRRGSWCRRGSCCSG